MEFNDLKVGDIVRPYTNDVNNVDYVTTTGKYKVVKLYREDNEEVERMDIECDDFGDIYKQESPSDFEKIQD